MPQFRTVPQLVQIVNGRPRVLASDAYDKATHIRYASDASTVDIYLTGSKRKLSALEATERKCTAILRAKFKHGAACHIQQSRSESRALPYVWLTQVFQDSGCVAHVWTQNKTSGRIAILAAVNALESYPKGNAPIVKDVPIVATPASQHPTPMRVIPDTGKLAPAPIPSVPANDTSLADKATVSQNRANLPAYRKWKATQPVPLWRQWLDADN